MSRDTFERTYRLRVFLFLITAVAAIVLLNLAYRGINTIHRLEVVEAERDGWQRPAEIIQALQLSPGSTVVDLGSGAGYFALKLSAVVGGNGRVLAVDLRRLSLLFLQIRALLLNRHNITVIRGKVNDPLLPDKAADAVLVANTYHEFGNRKGMLAHIAQALVPNGRLVIVDRAATTPSIEPADNEAGHHHLDVTTVARELTESGFTIISRDDRFISQADGDLWWLIVCKRL